MAPLVVLFLVLASVLELIRAQGGVVLIVFISDAQLGRSDGLRAPG